MAADQVRMWRAPDHDRILLLAGRTRQYSIDPRGEYVFGVVAGEAMRSRRARERRVVSPGQLVAWDPSNAHAGTALHDEPWSSRLMIIEGAGLASLATDEEAELLGDVVFPDPVVSDRRLIRDFLRLHRALEVSTTRLERDERLVEWLRAMIEQTSAFRRSQAPLHDGDERAFRAACDYLGDRSDRNVSLDELALAAGIGKFRLIRLFRARTGLPPHALHVAHRVRLARRLLEAGDTVAGAAAATGFADQSHLHRHLLRSTGMTPAVYRRRFQRP